MSLDRDHEVSMTNVQSMVGAQSSPPCETKHLTADLYYCVTKKFGCSHGLSYGYASFCLHPDKSIWAGQACGAGGCQGGQRLSMQREGL